MRPAHFPSNSPPDGFSPHHHPHGPPPWAGHHNPSTSTTTSMSSTNNNNDNTTSSHSGFLTFLKTTLLPIIIALSIYLFLFHALLPLYRRHRARYSQYLPLNNLSLQPSILSTRLRSTFFRIFLPSHWARSQAQNRRLSLSSTMSHDAETELFSDEHGEAMVGFDLPRNRGGGNPIHNQTPRNDNTSAHPNHITTDAQTEAETGPNHRRRQDNMNRLASRGILAAREMNATSTENTPPTTNPANTNTTSSDPYDYIPPERRLSRELEEVFRDDSADEDSDEEVTVGRRSMSISVRRDVRR